MKKIIIVLSTLYVIYVGILVGYYAYQGRTVPAAPVEPVPFSAAPESSVVNGFSALTSPAPASPAEPPPAGASPSFSPSPPPVSPTPTLSPSAMPELTPPASSPLSLPPSVAVSPSPEPEATVPQPPNTPDVRFDFAVTAITGEGLSRTVAYSVANRGTTDAHNVTGRLEVFSQAEQISVSGSDHIDVNIGLLRAGETVNREIALSFGLFDGVKISQGGAEFVLKLTSDETTQEFRYGFNP